MKKNGKADNLPPNGLRILFADDEPALQELIHLELPRMGHEVTVCPDGTTAAAALERNTYDCLIVDLDMPGLNGIEVIERAKESLKSSLLLHAESGTSASAEELGRQVLTYGRSMSRAEMFARIDAVNIETIKSVAWKYIRDQEVAVAAIGPTQFLPDLLWFRTSTYNNFY